MEVSFTSLCTLCGKALIIFICALHFLYESIIPRLVQFFTYILDDNDCLFSIYWPLLKKVEVNNE